MFGWHHETTLKSFGRLSKEPPEQGGQKPADPPISSPGAENGDAPLEAENDTALDVRSLDA